MEKSASIQFFSERRQLLALYIIFFAFSYVSLLSPLKIAILGIMVCVMILSFIYSLRAALSAETFIGNHATFLIRTFWRSCLYMIYSGFVGLTYLLASTDYSAMKPCTDYFGKKFLWAVMNWGLDKYAELFSQCTKPFFHDNTTNIVAALFIMIFPILIYLLNRLILGWSHAIRGIMVAPSNL